MKQKILKVWEKVQSPFIKILFMLALVGVLLLVEIALWGGYVWGWSWVGVADYTSPVQPVDTEFERQKTLWDWLELLVIPVVLAIGGFLFNRSERTKQQQIASKNRQETIVEQFIDRLTLLMLENGLGQKAQEYEPKIIVNNTTFLVEPMILDKQSSSLSLGDQEIVRTIANGRTRFVLDRLEPDYQAAVVQFLYESNLIRGDATILNLSQVELNKLPLYNRDLSMIDLSGAILNFSNLSGAILVAINLKRASLQKANISGALLEEATLNNADLEQANLQGATLQGANLIGAILKETNLQRAILTNANLSRSTLTSANLHNAILTNADLTNANLTNANLRGAILTNARLHNADLTGADLTEAIVDEETLAQAASLDGVTRGELS